jgi:predicted transcriptional regulator
MIASGDSWRHPIFDSQRKLGATSIKQKNTLWRIDMSENDNTPFVAEVLSAYLSNNTVSPADLGSVIQTVKTAFGVSGGSAMPQSDDEPKKMEPAVSVKKSITPDALLCLGCGKPFKSLKRHLQSQHGLSTDEYRAAFGLKADYPTVAPNYSAQRSSLALSAGLGRKAAKLAPSKKVAVKKPGARKAVTKSAAE